MTSRPSSKRQPDGAAATAPAAKLARRSTHALLTEIVDYAGLFPPAGLDMPSAVGAYECYLNEDHAWMLGAFVVPAERVGALRDARAQVGAAGAWPISILASTTDEAARALGNGHDDFEVRALEIAPQDPKRIRALTNPEHEGVQVFHEVPFDERQEARLDAIAASGAAAKVRTGGVTAGAFPPPVLLADFMRSCAERGMPFKATAGLHHALRGRYRLTYQPRSARCEMFGFLEVALVAALLRLGRIDTNEAAALLGGSHPAADATADALIWSGHRLSVRELSETRSKFFRSFGSCSFEEPVAELIRLGLL